MRQSTAGAAALALVALALALRPTRADAPTPLPRPLPPLPAEDAGLPPLPDRPPRTAARPLAPFPFHLYWTAFRNSLSTSARGQSGREPWNRRRTDRSWGWIEVRSVRLLGPPEEDLTPTLRYLHEDGNVEDRTVMEVRTAKPISPGENARFAIEWDALLPQGP